MCTYLGQPLGSRDFGEIPELPFLQHEQVEPFMTSGDVKQNKSPGIHHPIRVWHLVMEQGKKSKNYIRATYFFGGIFCSIFFPQINFQKNPQKDLEPKFYGTCFPPTDLTVNPRKLRSLFAIRSTTQV